MGTTDPVAADYDRLAEAYAREVGGELAGKPLDRALLATVAEGAAGRGPVGDLGCGPGHVAAHLAGLGADVVMVDLSPAMVRRAAAAVPAGRALVGDLRSLPLADGSLAAAVCLYSLIHLDDDGLRGACREVARVLAPGGQVLVGYHRGDDTVHPGELWGVPVSLGFRFLPDALVTGALEDAGLAVTARMRREPYPGVEHPSSRGYVLAASS